jgi:hypothetical protein
MSRDAYRTTSGIIFGLIAVLQGIRIARQLPVQVGSTSIPMGVSWIAVVVAGGLCVWALRPSTA